MYFNRVMLSKVGGERGAGGGVTHSGMTLFSCKPEMNNISGETLYK